MTGQGEVRNVESGLEVGAKFTVPEGRDADSSRSKVSDDDGDEGVADGLSVEAGWMVSCIKVSTQLATLAVEENNGL